MSISPLRQSCLTRLRSFLFVMTVLVFPRGDALSRKQKLSLADVVDGPQSLVWRQAENRMHAARGLLAWILEQ